MDAGLLEEGCAVVDLRGWEGLVREGKQGVFYEGGGGEFGGWSGVWRDGLTDEVDSSPLLEHLQRGADQDATEVTGGAETASEAVEPAGRGDSHFVVVVGLDLGKLGQEVWRIGWLATDSGESFQRPLGFAFLDQIARGLRKQKQAECKNCGPDELDGYWDAVRVAIVEVLGALVDASSDKQTNGDSPLID